jgi:hypothetical protein
MRLSTATPSATSRTGTRTPAATETADPAPPAAAAALLGGGTLQSAPLKPSLQTHAPLPLDVPDPSHAPWSTLHAAQAAQLPPKKPTAQDEHVAPRQPVAQMHVPAAQDVLCSPQSIGTLQSPSPPTE